MTVFTMSPSGHSSRNTQTLIFLCHSSMCLLDSSPDSSCEMGLAADHTISRGALLLYWTRLKVYSDQIWRAVFGAMKASCRQMFRRAISDDPLIPLTCHNVVQFLIWAWEHVSPMVLARVWERYLEPDEDDEGTGDDERWIHCRDASS